MKKPFVIVFSVILFSLAWAILSPDASLDSAMADSKQSHGFTERSLNGSYASAGRADGIVSRSIGVTKFNGQGDVERFVSINTSDGAGGRKLIYIVSTGTYTVDRSGIGMIYFDNEFTSGASSQVTYDFVISKSTATGSRGKKGTLQATEITGDQREAGTTASLIEEFWTRREGV
jgi:hypothetical protein